MKVKKMICAVLVATILVSSTCMSAFAYWDGDREVGYYDFDLSIVPDDVVSMTNPIYRRYNRNWVASVNNVSSTSYPITYSTNMYEQSYLGAGKPYSLRGTGNIGNSYYSTSSIGKRVCLYASLDQRESPAGKYSKGQWSPDNYK